MKKIIFFLIMSFSLVSCNFISRNKSWMQYEEEGPTVEHTYSVIKNEQSNAYVGILKKHNLLKTIVVNSGMVEPTTIISVQFNDNREVEFIKISEYIATNNNQESDIYIKKINNKWNVTYSK